MEVKTEACYEKEMKKWKQKTQTRVFEHEYACTYIGLHMQASFMRTHTLSLRTHVHANTP